VSLNKNTCIEEPTQTFMEIFDMVSTSLFFPTAGSFILSYLILFQIYFIM